MYKPVRTSAKRIRHANTAEAVAVSLTVTCEQCGEQFGIAYAPEAAGLALAARQAKWLTEVLVWDHIQENKHKGSITVPAL